MYINMCRCTSYCMVKFDNHGIIEITILYIHTCLQVYPQHVSVYYVHILHPGSCNEIYTLWLYIGSLAIEVI